MESGHNNKIAPQPFNVIIVLGIICVLLSYAHDLLPDTFSDTLSLATETGSLIMAVFFRKYLHNFNAKKAIYWTNLSIVLSAGLIAIMVISDLIMPPGIHPDLGKLGHSPLFILAALFIILFFVFFLVVTINQAISLRNIDNDFIGLLKELGTANLLTLLVVLFSLLLHWQMQDYVVIKLLLSTLYLIPTFILILIFYKAKMRGNRTTK